MRWTMFIRSILFEQLSLSCSYFIYQWLHVQLSSLAKNTPLSNLKRKKNVTVMAENGPIKTITRLQRWAIEFVLIQILPITHCYKLFPTTKSHASPLSRLYCFICSFLFVNNLDCSKLLPYWMTSNGVLFTSTVSFSLGIARCMLYVYCVTLIGFHTEACVL